MSVLLSTILFQILFGIAYWIWIWPHLGGVELFAVLVFPAVSYLVSRQFMKLAGWNLGGPMPASSGCGEAAIFAIYMMVTFLLLQGVGSALQAIGIIPMF
jgi:hypothetical protein